MKKGLFFLVVCVLSLNTPAISQIADTIFPRVAYIDPYWAGYYWCSFGVSWNSSWVDSNYYYPQLKRMGITHSVTHGDAKSLSSSFNSAGIKILNENIGDGVKYTANSTDAHYEVGGDPAQTFNAFRWPPVVGEDYTDPSENPNPKVYRALIGTHQRGLLLESTSINPLDEPQADTYYFIIRAKITGSGNSTDSVAILHVWETVPGSQLISIPSLNMRIQQQVSGVQQTIVTDSKRLIRASDFSTSGAYVTIMKSVSLSAKDTNWNYYNKHITLEWIPKRNLYIDYVDVRGYNNYSVFVASDSAATLQSLGDGLVATHNINPSLNWHWYKDEPWEAAFRAFRRMSQLGVERGTRPLNGIISRRSDNIYSKFTQTVNPAFLSVDDYMVRGDSASSGADNIQPKYDNQLIDYALRPAITTANAAGYIPFWFTMQTACYKKGDVVQYRDPTSAELLTQANLAICYGAKGLVYFLYASLPAICGTESYRGIVDIVPPGGTPRTSKYVPNYKWYTLQDLHKKLDIIGRTLLNLHWVNAASVHRGQLSNVNSVISDIHSYNLSGIQDNYPSNTYVEAGIFDSTGSTSKYFVIVNRRGLSTESRNITTTFSLPSGSYEISDIASGKSWIIPSNGSITDLFQPGEGKLYKIGSATWSGNKNILFSTTVASGATLTVTPSAVISFASGASLIVNGVLNAQAGSSFKFGSGAGIAVYGTLNAQGTSTSMITFTSTGGTTPGSWGSINFYGSGASGSILNYVKMQYGTEIFAQDVPNWGVQVLNSIIENTINGVRYHNTNGWISDCIITNPRDHGIVAENGATAACYRNVITKTDQSGFGILYGGGSHDYCWQNRISGFNQGFGAIWGSSPTLGHPINNRVNNHITNCFEGLEIRESSYPLIGLPSNETTHSNSVHNCGLWAALICNCPDAIIYAQNVYWGTTDPVALSNLFSLSNVYGFNYGNPLSSCPWLPLGLPKVASLASQSGHLPSTSLSGTISSIQSNSEDVLSPGINLRLKGKYKEAKEYFKSVIVKQPKNIAAYIELYKTQNDTTREDIKQYFASLTAEAPPVAKMLLSYIYLKTGNVELAKQVNNMLIKQNLDSKVSTQAKLNNFYISLYNDNNSIEAENILNEALKNSELSTEIEFSLARQALAIYKGETPEHLIQKQSQKEVVPAIPTKIDLSQNYPNPFNPTTTISYQLSAISYVKLSVYDVLGREVAVLVDEMKDVGSYSTSFDGSRLASGVYFTRMIAQPQEGSPIVQVRKMLLTK